MLMPIILFAQTHLFFSQRRLLHMFFFKIEINSKGPVNVTYRTNAQYNTITAITEQLQTS